MRKIKAIIGWTLAIYAIVVFSIEGGIEILPLQLTALVAFTCALAIGGVFKARRAE